MKVGSDNISEEQRRLMARARESTESAVEALLLVIQDSDISSEREQLHPFWVELYESKSDVFLRSVPRHLVKEFRSFFEKLISVDKQLCEIDLAKLKTAFLLGAGASKPAPSNIPTVKELLPQLLLRGRRLDRDDVTKLADFCEERRIDNIEDLLTAAQLATFSSRNPTILRLLNYLLYGGETEIPGEAIYLTSRSLEQVRRARTRDAAAASVSSVAFLQDTLQVLFGLLASTMLPAAPNMAHEAIATFVKAHSGSAIVTTNYDCCMDLALEAVQVPLTYRLDLANRTEKDTGTAELIKLHGSLNW